MADTTIMALKSEPASHAADVNDKSQNVSRKRSYDETIKSENGPQDTSTTASPHVEPLQDVSHPIDQQILDPDKEKMPPPGVEATQQVDSSQWPPQSGQDSQAPRTAQTGSTQFMAELNTDAQEGKLAKDKAATVETALRDRTESNASSSANDPETELEEFNWIDLEERYHSRMKEIEVEESAMMLEFGNLCNVSLSANIAMSSAYPFQYFEIWAQAGSQREVDRSFKRCVHSHHKLHMCDFLT
jgi:hypothetical protein